ncbi:hypothetical protein EUTSA_v10009226mg [Eutrema salsugineum]|uniref:Uncharacterized protein n=1 Tax=Eutrema salsugineum TaxID=72664 RepID=V4KZ93_EUTSA|nr:hypothetical protein EUTSA_v10009226mg [Eutrema salsugineum]
MDSEFLSFADGISGGGSSVGEDGTGGIAAPVLSVNGSAIVWTDIRRRRNRVTSIVVAETFMIFCCCFVYYSGDELSRTCMDCICM